MEVSFFLCLIVTCVAKIITNFELVFNRKERNEGAKDRKTNKD